MNIETPGIGDNLRNAPLKEQLEARYPDIFTRLAELENAAALVPEKLRSDDESGKAQDLIKMMRVAMKQADGAREVEKEPYAQAVKEVNATFKMPIERVEKVMKQIMARVDAYLEEKAAAERLRREDEARRQREESERLAREAEDAERRRVEAERQRKIEEERAAEAERQRLKAVEEQRAAEARAAAAKAEEARLAQARLAREAAAARQKEIDEAAAAERAAQRKIDEAAAAEAKTNRETEEAAAAEAKRQAAKAREEQQQAEEGARAAKRDAKEAGRDEKAAMGAALRTEKRADRMDQAAGASDADMSRNRGELGTVASLARRWTCRVVDRRAIPLERLRDFINPDAIDAAVYRFMMAGQRELPGVVFEEITEARVA